MVDKGKFIRVSIAQQQPAAWGLQFCEMGTAAKVQEAGNCSSSMFFPISTADQNIFNSMCCCNEQRIIHETAQTAQLRTRQWPQRQVAPLKWGDAQALEHLMALGTSAPGPPGWHHNRIQGSHPQLAMLGTEWAHHPWIGRSGGHFFRSCEKLSSGEDVNLTLD